MTRARPARPSAVWLLGAAASGFLAGVFVMSEPRPARTAAPERTLVAPVTPPAPVSATPTIGANLPAELRQRHLTLPVQGLEAGDLRDTFDEMRGGSRRHEALDILAPRNAPVLAVEDGTVAKLFLSDAGGMTIYQFDPMENYAYYYAHLERYADGLKDGDRVRRGQVIGYVGTSGNAPRDTPHLHFAIFRLTDAKRWWQGTAIDPYPILKR
ncbi:MAG TPA: M23 family metallopeptidase [Vicinamibacterales bacterium]|nr:M23 family metallopeptidase [Vicinamibacterales bacterium]